jgi:hypothetical protein
MSALSCGRQGDCMLSCQLSLVDSRGTVCYHVSSLLWTAGGLYVIMSALSCGRQGDCMLSCQLSLVDSRGAVCYHVSSLLWTAGGLYVISCDSMMLFATSLNGCGIGIKLKACSTWYSPFHRSNEYQLFLRFLPVTFRIRVAPLYVNAV